MGKKMLTKTLVPFILFSFQAWGQDFKPAKMSDVPVGTQLTLTQDIPIEVAQDYIVLGKLWTKSCVGDPNCFDAILPTVCIIPLNHDNEPRPPFLPKGLVLTVKEVTIDHDGNGLYGQHGNLPQPKFIVSGAIKTATMDISMNSLFECVPIRYGQISFFGPDSAFDWDYTQLEQTLGQGGVTIQLPTH